jgi:NAD-dependent SIR2 family protein deacetylase
MPEETPSDSSTTPRGAPEQPHLDPLLARRERQILRRIEESESLQPGVADQVYRYFGAVLAQNVPGQALSRSWISAWKRIQDEVFQETPADPGFIDRVTALVDTIPDFDEQLLALRLEGKKVVFIFGAGASVPSGIPASVGLLTELWRRAKPLGRRELSRLEAQCRILGITDIEALLTAAYIADFAAPKAQITALLRYFLYGREPGDAESRRRRRILGSGSSVEQEFALAATDVAAASMNQQTLQQMFGLLTSRMLEAKPNPVHKAFAQFAKASPTVSVVTTNYDGCLEEQLSLDGIAYQTLIGQTSKAVDPRELTLIKMHGSINWSYCDSCYHFQEYALVKFKESVSQGQQSFSLVASCNLCSGLRKPLLVPPLALKFLSFPDLIDLWSAGKRLIDEADYLVVVGYSFPEADTYLAQMILRSMSYSQHQVVVIVNPDRLVADGIREKLTSQIKDFDTKRFLSWVGKGEEALPVLVAEWVKNPIPAEPSGDPATKP